MTTRNPHAEYYLARTETVTPENAVAWRARVVGILSNRDQTDLARVCNRLPTHMLIRYLAAEYMIGDATMSDDWAAICQRYAENIERETQRFTAKEETYLRGEKT